MKVAKIYCQEIVLFGLAILLTFGSGNFQSALGQCQDTKKLKNISLTVDFSRAKADVLIIKYKLINNSEADIFLLNRGDNLSLAKSQAVYVEPQKDGTIEISRGGLPNAAKADRSPTFPPEYGVSKLAPKETFEEELTVALPLQAYSLSRSYTNNPIAMPESVGEMRFCLGLLLDPATKITTSPFPSLANYMDVIKQTSLCSENFKM